MKLLLDTTYLLPIVGIAIKDLQKDALVKLAAEGNKISISEISLFELSAKAAKFVANKELLPERVIRGMRALVSDEAIEKISANNSNVLLTAFACRTWMTDFIDCLILSTALTYCDALITEDNVIHNLPKNAKYKELLTTTNNSDFEIRRYSSLLRISTDTTNVSR